jgi:hypothetical protein
MLCQTRIHLIVPETYRGHPLDGRQMPCRLKGRILNNLKAITLENLFTVHYHFYILYEAIDDLECLRCGYPSLLLGESVQPLDYRLNVLLSKKLLNKFFYIASNQ